MSHEQTINLVWILTCSALVLIMQAGFCLLEMGFTRSKNSVNVAIKNLTDFCISSLAFWALGFALMFGASEQGWIGRSYFLPEFSDDPRFAAVFLFQLMFCSTATTIVSGAVAERIRFASYLVIAVIVSILIYPIFGHWCWGGALEGRATGWLGRLGFIDFAGSTVVHSVGGWVALAAVLLLGPRIGQFTSDRSIQGHSLALSAVGAILLWFGWMGFNGGSGLELNGKVPSILINTNLAAAAGGVAAMCASRLFERVVSVGITINGTLAGLVAITAGCHLVSAPSAVLIGGAAGVISLLAARWLERAKIDDVAGVIPVHLAAGAWGTIAIPLLVDLPEFPSGLTRWEQLAVQMLGIGVCGVWSFGVSFGVLALINRVWSLRVTPEKEISGLNVSENGATTELMDLLIEMQAHQIHGEFSRAVHVEPHTHVGQIAAKYNAVLDRVQQEIQSREAAVQITRQAEERYRRFFEHAAEGIYQITANGRCLMANPKLAQILGYSSIQGAMEAISNEDDQRYVDPEQRQEFKRLLRDNDEVERFELQLKRADGETIWVSESACAIRDRDGTLKYVEGTIEDISDHRQHEEMRLAREKAIAANQAKSQFLATMSHELRTPLNGILGMNELLLRTPLNERQQQFVEASSHSGQALLRLINNVLDISKIEAGKMELDPHECHLEPLVYEVVDMFLPSATTQGVSLSCWIDSQLDFQFLCDGHRVRQILINLIANALKFTKTGSITVRAECVRREDLVMRVRLSVTDTGVGIPEDRQAALFAPFTQVDSSTSRHYGGTGLGLAICKQLVELMNGRIGVTSQVGAGSTFWFELPLRIASESPNVIIEKGSLKKAKVLVVTDESPQWLQISDCLTAWGCHWELAANEQSTERLVQRAAESGESFGAAIVGLSTRSAERLQLIEMLSRQHGITVVAVQSGSEPNDVRSTPLPFAQRVLLAPVRPSALCDALHSALAESPKRRPLTNADPVLQSPSEPSHTTELHHATGHVLIAEDNRINQLFVSELLKHCGCTFDIVNNGDEALQAVQNRHYDLVLMDCQMPEMDGFTATREIRRRMDEGLLPKSLPIIALTANALQGDREACLEAGMDDYLTKPIELPRMQEMLRHYLSRLEGASNHVRRVAAYQQSNELCELSM